MDTFSFGLKFWKRNIPLAIVSQFLSFISITADLMFPMLTGILLNYIIKGIPMKKAPAASSPSCSPALMARYRPLSCSTMWPLLTSSLS